MTILEIEQIYLNEDFEIPFYNILFSDNTLDYQIAKKATWSLLGEGCVRYINDYFRKHKNEYATKNKIRMLIPKGIRKSAYNYITYYLNPATGA